MSAKSTTACERCRSQKLRCTKEKNPGCQRCQKQKAICTYPRPPDRKALNAIKRSHGGIRKRPGPNETQDVGGASPGFPNQYNPISNIITPDNSSSGVPYERHNSLGSQSSVNESAALPSRGLGLSMLDLYWNRFYKSALIWYKPVLYQDYVEGKLPDYLLRAIFAIATIFIITPEEAPPNFSVDPAELEALRPFRARGKPWAESSLREVMPLAIYQPSLHVCQALGSLLFYNFAIGEGYAAEMVLAFGYRACLSGNYNKAMSFTLEDELKRRCIWESWSSLCIAGEPKSFVRSAWSEMAGVPLPCTILSSGAGVTVVPNERMDENWIAKPCSDLSSSLAPDGKTPIYAGYLKMIGIWAKVQLFTAEASRYTYEEKISEMTKLSEVADKIYWPDWSPIRHTVPHGSDHSDRLDTLIPFESLYRVCKMILHASVVPRFSGLSNPPSAPAGLVQRAAETVIEHAVQLALVFANMHAKKVDVSITVPIAGYAAFVGGASLLIYSNTKAQDDPAQGPLKRHVYELLTLLDAVHRFWKVLDGPYETLRDAAEYYGLIETEGGAQAAAERLDRPRRGKLQTVAPGYVYRAEPGPGPGSSGKSYLLLGEEREEKPVETEAPPAPAPPAAPAAPPIDNSFGVPDVPTTTDETFGMDWWDIPTAIDDGLLDSLGFVFDQSWY